MSLVDRVLIPIKAPHSTNGAAVLVIKQWSLQY